MANHPSAAKRARQALRKTARNHRIRSRVKTSTRAFRDAITAGDKTASLTALESAAKQLRRAASKGVLHKRTASRRVSRLMRAANKAGL
ncbi:MAG: 30S ribosomal protein S20 [Deltaproteobacteria bacterium]|nr:30S ribosomal protein S20 [Deltaproteobacteria bacterium]